MRVSAESRSSIAVTRLLQPVMESNGLPGAAISLINGGNEVGKELVGNSQVDLGQSLPGALLPSQTDYYSVSFTGSERVGKIVGSAVQDRFGKVRY